MKFVALVSGGKDSIYATIEAIRNGHELVCAAHLSPPEAILELDSYMYQSAASNVVSTLVTECLGVPFVTRSIRGRSINISLVYSSPQDRTSDENSSATSEKTETDEVEDLFFLLQDVILQYPQVKGVSCGAILSTYQRVRLENVCSRLALTPLCYLWRWKPQRELLDLMIQDDVNAIVVKVAYGLGLIASKHLNRTLFELRGHFATLQQKFGFHVCGEGGEYETLVLDCPLFKRKLVLDEVEVVSDKSEDNCGVLKIVAFHVEEKCENAVPCIDEDSSTTTGEPLKTLPTTPNPTLVSSPSTPKNGKININNELRHSETKKWFCLHHAKIQSGGMLYTSEIMSPQRSIFDDESRAASQEALRIFDILRGGLEQAGMTPHDVIFCHLYLSEICHLSQINVHYRNFFGDFLPPSRSCVAVGKNVLPGGRRVLLDVCAQRNSGIWMRCSSKQTGTIADNICDSVTETRQEPEMLSCSTNKLREVLHVQGLSHWAPICVGPYSQANTIRNGLVFLAGQIGLHPPNMQLCSPEWTIQLRQCWTNAAAVLDSLSYGKDALGTLTNCLGALVYVNSNLLYDASSRDEFWERARSICIDEIEHNGRVKAGTIDELNANAHYHPYMGYEDEGTMRELVTDVTVTRGEPLHHPDIPILFVGVPEMPLGALCEIELVCGSSKSCACLDIQTKEIEAKHLSFAMNQVSSRFTIYSNDAYCRRDEVSWDCGYDPRKCENVNDQESLTIAARVETAVRFIKGCCALVSSTVKYCPHSLDERRWIDVDGVMNELITSVTIAVALTGMATSDILHFRLYYCIKDDDGLRLRSALIAELSKLCPRSMSPSCSVIPVKALEGEAIMAVHVLVTDLVHMETEMWIRHNRQY